MCYAGRNHQQERNGTAKRSHVKNYNAEENGMTDETTAVVEEEQSTVPSERPSLDSLTSLEVVDKAQIEQQIATAKAYPRSVEDFRRKALTLATLDEETAGSMFYVIPRAGKRIEGPGVRLSEVVAQAWGNIRASGEVISEDENFITAMGTCLDLESNVAIRVTVRRRIRDSKGHRYNADMIAVTGNAATSIALRNAVFKVIPMSLVQPIYEAARQASLGEGGTLKQKRQNMLAWFAKLEVTEEQIFGVLGVKGLDDVGEDELITLRGVKTAIQTGETTAANAFRGTEVGDAATEELNLALEEENADAAAGA